MRKFGIALIDLLGLPVEARMLIPEQLRAELAKLQVLEHRSTTTGTFYAHSGRLTPLGDVLFSSVQNWPIEIPGLNAGIPFRLAYRRASGRARSDTEFLEPVPQDFVLDLELDRFAIKIPGLTPARRVGGGDDQIAPPSLTPDPSVDGVRILGRAVLRVMTLDGQVHVGFIAESDPFDPFAPTGEVVSVSFEPPHFFIGDSRFGLTIGNNVIDGSRDYTPPAIMARGQAESWVGVAIEEATFYCPPDLGTLAVGVRDVLIGDPSGLQGELRVSFGRAASSADEPVRVEFHADGASEPLAIAAASEPFSVQLSPTQSSVRGRASWSNESRTDELTGRWVLPDGTRPAESPESPWFEVRDGSVVRFQPATRAATEDALDYFLEHTYVFQRAATDAGHGVTPTIDVRDATSGNVYENVLSLSLGVSTAASLVFSGNPSAEAQALSWALTGPSPQQGSGATFAPRLPQRVGTYDLTLTAGEQRVRRVRISVVEGEAALLVGASGGVRDRTGQLLETVPGALRDLAAFHRSGVLRTVADGGSTDPQPAGALREVVVRDAPAAPAAAELEHQEIATLRYGVEQSDAEAHARALTRVLELIRNDPEGRYFIIGRTDDTWRGEVRTEDDHRSNAGLAHDRATAMRDYILNQLQAQLPDLGQRLFARGEQEAFADNDHSQLLPPQAVEISRADGGSVPLIWVEHPEVRSIPEIQQQDPIRQRYRRVEIHRVGPGTSTPPTASDRSLFIPGADRSTIPAPTHNTPPTPYEVSLVVRWDSPTVIDEADAIPTLAEIKVKVPGDNVRLPAPQSGSNQREGESDTPLEAHEIITVCGRWTHDARAGEALFVAEVLSTGGDPNGLFPRLEHTGLAVALAFGPTLMSAVRASEDDGTELGVDTVMLLGLFLAGEVLSNIRFGEDTFLLHHGKVAFSRIALESRTTGLDGSGTTVLRLLCDYTVELGLLAPLGVIELKTLDDEPLKVQCKNVGLMLRIDNGTVSHGGFDFTTMSMEVKESGRWKISGPLADLLGIAGVRTFAGSLGIELDLRFAIDLGIVSLTGATIRLSVVDGHLDFQLRGLSASVDIPGALAGTGSLTIGDNKSLRGALDLQVIPANVQARGALAIEGEAEATFVMVEVGVKLPAGIPLGGSGLGLFGFIGRFVANGTRDFLLVTSEDPIDREVDWYTTVPATSKYKRQPGQWALGLGAVVGTLPDSGFTFNATGMLVIEFPDPLVLFGIQAYFARTLSLPSEGGPDQSSDAISLELLGLLAIDKSSVRIGIRGKLEISRLLRLEIPFSAFFPLPPYPNAAGEAYVRLGQDGYRGSEQKRLGNPITLTLLPDSLNVRAWAFIMIEECRLPKLGNGLVKLPADISLDLQGFSIGFGAGFTVDWGAGPLRLVASIATLIGFGTRPLCLVGVLAMRGELTLLFLGLSFDGTIGLKLRAAYEEQPAEEVLFAEICASISFLFFSVRACISFKIGNELPPTLPPSPLMQISLVDRHGVSPAFFSLPAADRGAVQEAPVVMQCFRRDDLAGLDEDPRWETATVWPDTVPLLQFAHPMSTELLSEPEGHTWSPGIRSPHAGVRWSGSSELKYSYRLLSVELKPLDADGQALRGEVAAGWWWPSHRSGLTTTQAERADVELPSEHETVSLALLSWKPWLGFLQTLGSSGAAGDPVRSIERACEQPEPSPACAWGERAESFSGGLVITSEASPAPFVSRFAVRLREELPQTGRETHAIEAQYAANEAEVGKLAERDDAAVGCVIGQLTRFGRLVSTLRVFAELAPSLQSVELVLATRRRSYDIVAPQICDELTQLPEAAIWLQRGFFAYRPRDSRDSMQRGPGSRGLQLVRSGLIIEFARTVERARLTFRTQAPDQRLVIQALNADGAVIGERTETLSAGATFELSTAGIASVSVTHTQSHQASLVVLERLCVARQSAGGDPAWKPDQPGPQPRVLGRRANGELLEWPVVGNQTRGDETHLRYRAPAGDFCAFQIEPWSAGTLNLIEVCGITSEAARQRAQDAGQRAALLREWRAHLNTRPVHPLLEPGRRYQLQVIWQGAVWQKTDDSTTPPEPEQTVWSEPQTERYYFQTAAQLSTDLRLPEYIDERTFHPLHVGRYLQGLSPSDGTLGHFLEDPLLAHFEVGYLEQLLALYGCRLELQLKRSDPPAHSRAVTDEDGHDTTVGTPLIDLLHEWVVGQRRWHTVTEQRILAAAQRVPCLPGTPDLGPVTAVVTPARLDPCANYDLTVNAIGPSPANETFVLGRCHFKTSRYRNANELLASFAFRPVGTEPCADRQREALVQPADIPWSDTWLGDDGRLEQALTALGMAAWPLAKASTTTLLWQNVGANAWYLRGVLLDGDEPLRRPRGARRRNDASGWSVEPEWLQVHSARLLLSHGRSQLFVPASSNVSWTRVLLLAPRETPPLVLPEPNSILQVQLGAQPESPTSAGPEIVATGQLRIPSRPLAAFEELP